LAKSHSSKISIRPSVYAVNKIPGTKDIIDEFFLCKTNLPNKSSTVVFSERAVEIGYCILCITELTIEIKLLPAEVKPCIIIGIFDNIPTEISFILFIVSVV